MNKIFFCILHVSTCNLRWILSLFRPGMVEGVYDVKVTVDGVLIPIENMCQPRTPASDKCQFEVNNMRYPQIPISDMCQFEVNCINLKTWVIL